MARRDVPHLHVLPELSDGAMYDRTQTDENIKDGDLFVFNDFKTVGFLAEAWPVFLYGEEGRELHQMVFDGRQLLIAQKYPETFRVARLAAKKHGLIATPGMARLEEELDNLKAGG